MQTEPAPKNSSRRRKFFLLGVVFELCLILLCFILPNGFLSVEVRNLALVTHYPLLLLAEGSRFGETAPTAILFLLVALAVMSCLCRDSPSPKVLIWRRS